MGTVGAVDAANPKGNGKAEKLECGPPANESNLALGTTLIVSEGSYADKYGTVIGLILASGERVGPEIGLGAGTVALKIGPYNWKGENGWLPFPSGSLCTVAA